MPPRALSDGRSASADPPRTSARSRTRPRGAEGPLLPPAALDDAAKRLRVLGHPARLQILDALAAGPSSVGELAERLAVEPYAASKHLAELLKVGIVRRSQDGNFAVYTLAEAETLKAAALVCRAVVREHDLLARLAAGEAPPLPAA